MLKVFSFQKKVLKKYGHWQWLTAWMTDSDSSDNNSDSSEHDSISISSSDSDSESDRDNDKNCFSTVSRFLYKLN